MYAVPQMLVLIALVIVAAALKGALVALDVWSMRRIEASEVHARFQDPQLESIRQRCAKYGDRFPHDPRKNEYRGMETALETMPEELRAMAGPGVRRPRRNRHEVFEYGYSRSHAN